MKLKVSKIDWDTDGDKKLAASLPKEVIVDAVTEDEAIDRASDKVGFCINAAKVEAADEPTKKKVKRTKHNLESFRRDVEKRLHNFAINPDYVAFVGEELRVGVSCSQGIFPTIDGKVWMKELVKTVDCIVGNLTFMIRDEKDRHVFGRLTHDRPKKMEFVDGEVKYLTEFRCEIKR